MSDPRHQLQQLLDHPQADPDRPAARAFTAAVMARVQGEARVASGRSRVLPWCLAVSVLAGAWVVPGSWLGEELDPASLVDGAPDVDTLVELIIASLAAGALLLRQRRSLA
jgi:hypothetical protein